MSNSVDNKIVSMEFDNRNFENNVQTSLSTLDKLKQALNFSGAAKGLSEIESASGKVNMSGLSSAVESVQVKFSALEVVAITAISNMTNKAIDAGERMLKALSVDQITAGWEKFSDKTTSVATLVAQGNAIEDVNEQLDRLNWFTDETSYNFTAMVSNIAKFTASGQGLEDSVTAMEGIATWAALSGQNAQTASNAMYQLSQAMGSGVMRKEDYKSIQNASMDTQEFRQACLDAGIALGTLKDNGDGTFKSLVADVKDGDFTISQFADHLTQDAWLTSDVMMKVFNDYSGAVNGIYEAAEEKGMLASEIIDEIYTTAEDKSISVDEAIGELGYDFDSFALKAFEAAQKARTFTDAIDSVKDAVSTGWMNTFELIFGDSNQATEVWTDLANTLWDIFAAGGEVRNTILEMALHFAEPWESIKEKISGVTDVIDKVTDSVGTVTKSLETYQDLVDRVWKGDYNNWGDAADRRDLLSAEGYDPMVIQQLVNKGYQYKLTLEDVEKAYSDLGLTMDETGDSSDNLSDSYDGLTNSISHLTDEQLEQAGLTEDEISLYRALEKEADRLGISVNDLAEEMANNDGRTLLIDSFKNIGSTIMGIGQAMKEAIADIFNIPSIGEIAVKLYSLIRSLNELTEKFRLTDKETGELNENGEKLKRTFAGLAAIVHLITKVIGSALKLVLSTLSALFKSTGVNILDLTASIGDAIVSFHDWVAENEFIEKAFSLLSSSISAVINSVKALCHWISEIEEIKSLGRVVTAIGLVIRYLMRLDNITLDDIKTALDGVWRSFKTNFPKATAFIERIITVIGSAIDKVKSFAEATGAISVFNDIGTGISNVIGVIENVISTLKNLDSVSFSDIADGISSIWSAICSNFSIDTTKLTTIGKNIIQGLVNGVTSYAPTIVAALKNIGTRLVNAIKNVLGIHSPSTVFFEIGKNICQGLVNGIKYMLSVVVESVKTMGTHIINALTNRSGKKGIFSGLLDYLSTNGFAGFSGVIKGTLSFIKTRLSSAMELFSANVLVRFTEFYDKYGKPIKAAITKLGSILKAIIEFVFGPMDQISLNSILDITEKILAIMVLFKTLNILSSITNTFESIGSSLENLTAAKKWKAIASCLRSVALVLVAFAGCMILIGGMDDQARKAALVTMIHVVILLGVLLAAMAVVASKTKSELSLAAVAAIILALAASLAIMVATLKTIDDMQFNDLGKSLGLMFGMLTALVVSAILIGRLVSGAGLKSAAALVTMLAALKMMLPIIDEYRTFDWAGSKIAIKRMAEMLLLLAVTIAIATSGLKSGANATGTALLVLAVIIGLKVMLSAITELGAMPYDQMKQGLLGVTAIMGLITAMLVAINLTNKGGVLKKGEKAASSFTGLAIALLGIAAAIYIYAKIPEETLKRGGAIVLAVLAVMTTVMAIMGKCGAGSLKVGPILAMIIGFGLLIAEIAVIIKQLSHIYYKSALASATALSELLLAMGVTLRIVTSSKADAKSIYKWIVAMAAFGVVVYGLSAIIIALNDAGIDGVSAIAQVTALSELLIAMAGCLALLSKTAGTVDAKNLAKCITSMFFFAIIAAEASAVLYELKECGINGTDALVQVAALSELLLAMSGCLVLLTKTIGKEDIADMGDCILAIAAFGLVAAEAGLVLYELQKLNIDGGEAILQVTALSELLLAMTACTAICSLFGGAASAAVAGIGALGLFVSAVIAFLELIAEINTLTDGQFADNLDVAIGIMEKVGAAIGNFLGGVIGGVVGGTITAISSTLPQLGSDLSSFMTNADSFFTGAEDIDTTAIDNLIKALSAIVLATFWNSLSGLVGKSSLIEFSETLGTFGDGLMNFSNSIADLTEGDLSKITIASEAGEKLATMAQSIPNEGGALAKIMGENDLASFGKKLATFGKCLVDYSEAVSDLTEDDVEKIKLSCDAGNSLAALGESVPNEGGLAATILGENDMATFGASIVAFGSCLVDYADIVKDLDEESASKIDLSANAATSLTKMAGSVPNEGGWAATLLGENDMATFGASIVSFATSLMDYADTISDISESDVTHIETSAAAIEALAAAAETIPNEGGVWGAIAGNQNYSTFGNGMIDVANGVSAYIDVANDISDEDIDSIKRSKDAIKAMVDAAKKIPNTDSVLTAFAGENDYSEFGNGMYDLANGIKRYSTVAGELTEDDVTAIKSSKDAVKAMADAAKQIPNEGGLVSLISGDNNDIPGFIDSMCDLASGVVDYADTVSDFKETDLSAIRTSASGITAISDAAKAIPNEGGLVSLLSGDNNDISGFIDGMRELAKGVVDYSDTVSDFKPKDLTAIRFSAAGISAISNAAKAIPNEGGLVALLSGDNNDISGFIDGMCELAKGVVDYSDTVSDFKETNLTAIRFSAAGIRAIAEAAAEIPNEGGLVSYFSGDNNDVSGFIDGMNELASGIIAYANTADDIDEAKISAIRSSNAAIIAIKNVGTTITTNFTNTANLETAKSYISELVSVINELSNIKTSGLGDMSKTFESVGKISISKLTAGMSSGSANAKSVITKLVTSMVAVLKTGATTFRASGRTLITSLALGMNGVKGGVSSAARAIAASAVAAVRSNHSSMSLAGQYLGSGLVSGINSKQTAAYNAGYALGRKAVQGEKDGQASHSPSKLTIQAGKWLGEGLVIGMQKIGTKVYNAGYSMGETAVDSLSNSISNIASLVTDGIDAEPTIRPILDLSDIKAGAGAIGNMLDINPTVGVLANTGSISSMMNNIQNGASNDDVVSAITDLGRKIGKMSNNTYNVNGVTYDDGSSISDAVRTLVRAARVERRV